MEKVIDVWSDNWHAEEVINIIHDYGYRTAGMTRETIGVYAENVEWGRCKDGELPSMCVSLFRDKDNFIHGIDEVEEKPLFLYKLTLVVPDNPDDVKEDGNDEMGSEEVQEEEETESLKSAIANDMDTATIAKNIKDSETEEKTYTAVLNIGLTTADKKHELDSDKVIDFIGMYIDCTITKTIGFYKGVREDSLKVETYGVTIHDMVALARYLARSLSQECVAVTINGHTVFVSGICNARECAEMMEELER